MKCIKAQKRKALGTNQSFSKNLAGRAINSVRYLYLPTSHLSSLFFPQSILFYQPAHGQGFSVSCDQGAREGQPCLEISPGVVL